MALGCQELSRVQQETLETMDENGALGWMLFMLQMRVLLQAIQGL